MTWNKADKYHQPIATNWNLLKPTEIKLISSAHNLIYNSGRAREVDGVRSDVRNETKEFEFEKSFQIEKPPFNGVFEIASETTHFWTELAFPHLMICPFFCLGWQPALSNQKLKLFIYGSPPITSVVKKIDKIWRKSVETMWNIPLKSLFIQFYVAKRPLKSYKICNNIFEHGFDPPPSLLNNVKKYQKWYTIDALGAIFAIFKC